jgi:hypothetical protein
MVFVVGVLLVFKKKHISLILDNVLRFLHHAFVARLTLDPDLYYLCVGTGET